MHKLIKIKICQPTFKNRYIQLQTSDSSKELQISKHHRNLLKITIIATVQMYMVKVT